MTVTVTISQLIKMDKVEEVELKMPILIMLIKAILFPQLIVLVFLAYAGTRNTKSLVLAIVIFCLMQLIVKNLMETILTFEEDGFN